MTYEEYKLLIKAKLDEVRDKTYIDLDSTKTRNGITDYGLIAHIVLARCEELYNGIDRIKNYANSIIDKIKMDKNRAEKERYDNIQKALCSDQKEQEPQKTCNDCGFFMNMSEGRIGYCSKTGEAVFNTVGACGNWNPKQCNGKEPNQ